MPMVAVMCKYENILSLIVGNQAKVLECAVNPDDVA